MPGSIANTVLLARAAILDTVAHEIERLLATDIVVRTNGPRTLGEEAFADAVHALVAAGVKGVDVALVAKTTSGPVSRWWNRLATPHPVIRREIAEKLPRLARAEAEALRSMTRSELAEAA